MTNTTPDRGTAVEAAQSVAQAVQRVADAAVAEIQKRPTTTTQSDFHFFASGARFRIRGTGLGTSGTVKIGGRQMVTRAWGTMEIDGDLPADIPSGDVVVYLDDKTTRRGHFTRS